MTEKGKYQDEDVDDVDDDADVEDLEPTNDEEIADDDDGIGQTGTKKTKEDSNTLTT